jgi:hypothetical protein
MMEWHDIETAEIQEMIPRRVNVMIEPSPERRPLDRRC